MLRKSIRPHLPSCTVVMAASLLVTGSALAATPIQDMSSTVETLCPELKGTQGLSRTEQDVLARCGELKLKPGQSFSNLSTSQLDGLSNMTSDESSSMGTSSIQMSGLQVAGVLGRIKTLRAKATGTIASNLPTQTQPGQAVGQQSSLTNSGFQNTPTLSSLDRGETGSISLDEEPVWSFSNMADYGKWGVFANGSFATGDRDATNQEPGFDLTSWSFLLGTDYRVSDNFFIGGALGYAATDTDVDDNAANIDLDGFGASLFTTYLVDAFHFDLIGSYSIGEFDTLRNVNYSVPSKAGGLTTVNQQFASDSDVNDWLFSVGAGYDYALKGTVLSPYGRLSYLRSDIDGYTEQLQNSNGLPGFGLALAVDDQEVTSLKTNLGLQLSHAFSTRTGIITPYLSVDWEHEFDNDARTITAEFAEVSAAFNAINTISIQTDDPDRDYANLGLGVSSVLPGGTQLFLDYSTLLFHDYISLHTVVAGIRFEF